MFVPHSPRTALLLIVVSMVCWASWPNLLRALPRWRLEFFYVDYTNRDGDTRVVEYRAEDGKVDTSSARTLLAVDQPFPNHNGGLLLFGPDDMLYIGLGDGGGGGDPDRNGLDLGTLLGKILRIDPAPDGKSPYTIPDDNPFVDESGARPEIYSYGLRNPWRFSFDSETEDLSIGDVGQDAIEEIDLVGRGEGSGANFGWSAFEGDHRFNEDQDPEGAIPPVLTALHADGNCSITGGLIVRDRSLKSLYGRYLWGDGRASALDPIQALVADYKAGKVRTYYDVNLRSK